MKVLEFEIPIGNGKPARVLDVGCGQGWGVLEAARQDAIAFGLDLSPVLLRKAREHTGCGAMLRTPEFLLGKSDQLPFRDSSFDLVLCTEVIEHTLGTEETLSEIARVLEPGGFLVISFPVKPVENLIAGLSDSFLAYSGHVRQFSLVEMRLALAGQQFRVLKVVRKYFEWSLYWLVRAVARQIPRADRTNGRYGIEVSEDAKWRIFDSYYKRLWAKAVRAKVGIPLLWLGNRLLPKSFVLLCEKEQGGNDGSALGMTALTCS